MKNLLLNFALALSWIILLSGCNNDDDTAHIQQEFLKASVDGKEFKVEGSNALFNCKKLVTEFGSINLSVKVETEEGNTIEFLVLNYKGQGPYPIGNLTSSFEGTFLNGNWMNYAETSLEGFWSTNNLELMSDIDFLEITRTMAPI